MVPGKDAGAGAPKGGGTRCEFDLLLISPESFLSIPSAEEVLHTWQKKRRLFVSLHNFVGLMKMFRRCVLLTLRSGAGLFSVLVVWWPTG